MKSQFTAKTVLGDQTLLLATFEHIILINMSRNSIYSVISHIEFFWLYELKTLSDGKLCQFYEYARVALGMCI